MSNINSSVGGSKKKNNFRLTDGQIERILRLSKENTPEQIANMVGCSVRTVNKLIKEHSVSTGVTTISGVEKTEILSQLYASDHWESVQKQLLPEELKTFEKMWVSTIIQFKEDVFFTELSQIKDWIIYSILFDRTMEEDKHIMDRLLEQQLTLDKQMKKPDEKRDKEIILTCKTEISYCRAARQDNQKKLAELSQQRASILKDIKGTRNQRLQIATDAKVSLLGFLRMMEEEDLRTKEGKEIELMKMATLREEERLSDFHTYGDGSVNKPILNSHTV